MRLFLAPEDVWLFRDGRPFDAASSHRARGRFPPYPSVVQGAVRTHELILRNVDLKDKEAIRKAVGTADDYGNLRMRGPFPAKYADGKLTRFFPRPADWFPVKGDDSKIQALPPQPRGGFVTSADDDLLQLLLPPDDFHPDKKEPGEWLTYEDLQAYLTGGESGKVTPAKSDSLFLRESRVGIQIKAASRAVEQGMLYEAEFVRPKDNVGLYLEVDGYDETEWRKRSMLRLGGESRAARYQVLDEAVEWPPLDPVGRKFKVYFATPAYFSGGWRPSNWSHFLGVDLKPVAVAIQGYDTVSGFDYAAHSDKPGLRYVPAGSVYYFDAEGKEIKLTPPFTEAMGEIGFGQIMIAAW